MKKILIISMVAPFDKRKVAGSKTHNFYLKHFLKSEELSIRLLSFCEEQDYQEAKRDLNEYGVNAELIKIKHDVKSKFARNLLSISSKYNPFDKNGNFTTSYFEREIKKYLLRYKSSGYIPDLIILSWTQIGLFIKSVKKIYPEPKYVVSEYDVSFQGYVRKTQNKEGFRKFLWNIKTKKLKKSELEMIGVSDLVVVQNDKDSRILEEGGIEKSKILTIVPYYDDYSGVQRRIDWEFPSIIFYGAMNRPENYECAIRVIENILPKIDENIIFYVIGGAPVQKLKEKNSESVKILGFVEDITPYLEKALCMVAPLTMGAGIKVKTIEMLAAGVPVITNEIGIEGIAAVPGDDYIACEDDEEFIEAIQKIVSKGIDIEEISYNSKRLVSNNFELNSSGRKYEKKLISL